MKSHRGRATPQGPPGPESGGHAQGTAGHSATATLAGRGASRRSRRTNGRAGPRTAVPYNIPARVVPAGSESPQAPSAPGAPGAPAGHCRTDGSTAWVGHSPTAAVPQGAGASAGCTTTTNYAPQPLIPPSRSVASTGGPSEQLDVLQGTYHPRYQDIQGYTTYPTLASPEPQPGGVVPPSNPSPPAPFNDGTTGQVAYVTGSASATSGQYFAEMYLRLDASNQTHQTALDVGPYPAVPSQSHSVHPCICNGKYWFAYCDLAWGHCKAAVASSWQFLSRECACPSWLPDGAVPQKCPRAVDHLLTWMNTYLTQFNQSQQSGPSAASTSTAPSRTIQSPFTAPLTHEISPPTQDICQPSDVPQVLTVNRSDTAGPSSPPHASPRRGTLSNRRKRPRRVLQSSDTGSTGMQVDPMDKSLGFVSLNQQPEVQEAMRNLVDGILKWLSCNNHKLEPKFGDPEAADLTAIAPGGYGMKGKSICSVFFEVNGNEFKCLWCGDVQKDKFQRALGHFRAIHLGHEPFLCTDIHADTKVCNLSFASNEARADHKRKKKTKWERHCAPCGRSHSSISNWNRHLKKCKRRRKDTNGKLDCAICGGSYTSFSDWNRHLGKCDSGQADPGHDDNEYGDDDDEYGDDDDGD